MSEALTTIEARPLSPFEPSSYVEALAMAETFSKSGMTKAKTKEQAFMIMATARSLGIPSESALRTFHVIEGVVTLSADDMVALCLRQTNLCEYFDCVERTETSATYATKRRTASNRPEQRVTYTLEEATAAGLVKSDGNWKKTPGLMCEHRAASRLARRVYPDIIRGFYTEDEAREIAAPPPIVDGEVVPIVNAAKPATAVVEAHAVESEETPEVKWARRLNAATNKKDGDVIAAEIQRAIPEKTDPIRMRLRGIYDSRVAAKWAVEPPHDPQTGEVLEPGANG